MLLLLDVTIPLKIELEGIEKVCTYPSYDILLRRQRVSNDASSTNGDSSFLGYLAVCLIICIYF